MNADKTVTAVTKMVSAQTHTEVTAVTVPKDTAAMVERVQVYLIQYTDNINNQRAICC